MIFKFVVKYTGKGEHEENERVIKKPEKENSRHLFAPQNTEKLYETN